MLGTVPEAVVWAIFLLPVASLLAIALYARPLPRLSAYITIAAVGLSLLLSLWALDSVIQADGQRLAFDTHELLSLRSLGVEFHVNVGLRVDGLTALMLLVVTGVSLPGAG